MTPEFDTIVDEQVLLSIDAYSQRAERDVMLIRFLNDDDVALYEPDLFEAFGNVQVHDEFIQRLQAAIQRLGGEVTIAFMDSEFYETWLGVNDFDDSRELHITWARQQLRGL